MTGRMCSPCVRVEQFEREMLCVSAVTGPYTENVFSIRRMYFLYVESVLFMSTMLVRCYSPYVFHINMHRICME